MKLQKIKDDLEYYWHKNKQKIISASIVLAIVLVTSALIYMRSSASLMLERSIKSAISTWEKSGYIIKYDGMDNEGVPPSLKVSFRNLSVKIVQENTTWEWFAPKLSISANMFMPERVTIDLSGRQSLKIDGDTNNMVSSKSSLTLDLYHLSRVDGVEFVSKDLAVNNETMFSEISFAGHRLPKTSSDLLYDFYEIRGKAKNINLSPRKKLAMDNLIKEIYIDGKIVGELDLSSLGWAISDWKDIGGGIDLDKFYIDWAPLKAQAQGIIALDDYMQPIASMNVTVLGLFETLDSLYEHNIVSQKNLSVARIVLGQMAVPSEGGKKALASTMAIQENVVSIDRVEIANIPVFTWGGLAGKLNISTNPDGSINRQIYSINNEGKLEATP